MLFLTLGQSNLFISVWGPFLVLEIMKTNWNLRAWTWDTIWASCRDISAFPFVFSLDVSKYFMWSTGLLQLLFTHTVMFPCCFRQEFVSDQCPDLTREVYLQDIHCVGSLCKLYFRELPNPLLTYELYKKFTVRPLAVLVPLQQCGCAADSSMTAVWDSLWLLVHLSI